MEWKWFLFLPPDRPKRVTKEMLQLLVATNSFRLVGTTRRVIILFFQIMPKNRKKQKPLKKKLLNPTTLKIVFTVVDAVNKIMDFFS